MDKNEQQVSESERFAEREKYLRKPGTIEDIPTPEEQALAETEIEQTKQEMPNAKTAGNVSDQDK